MAASVLVEPCHNAIPDRFDGAAVASLRDVTKKFGRQIALDHFSLELRRGEVVLAWMMLACYTVIFLLAAALVFRRQEAQAYA